MLGEGPERFALEDYAEKLGVASRVTFLGVKPWTEIGAYYRHAELFVFASDTETQGLVLQEAQIMGVPVVAVGAHGTLSSLEHGYSGYLVAAGDTAELTRYTQQLLSNEDQRQLFSQQAREYGARLSPAAIARQVLDTYAMVLKLPPDSLSHFTPEHASHLGCVANPRRRFQRFKSTSRSSSK